MGVPGLVAWLYHNYKKTNFITRQLFTCDIINPTIHTIDKAEHLLLDANGLIYSQIQKVCEENPNAVNNIEIFEKKIIKRVIDYIDTIISIIKPTKTIYIAFDGVAPMAKIKQQRMRRFKLIYDREIKKQIADKYEKPKIREWCTAAITPGTIFMDKLMKSINIWIRSKEFCADKIILSSSYSSGEGEHKIFQYIKKNIIEKENIIIYGLDADLLFLSLVTKKNSLVLMRETSAMEVNSSHAEGFSYLSIDALRNILTEILLNKVDQVNNARDINRVIPDFVFLCYFCGNDFIPHIPSLSLKPHNNRIINGLESILNALVDAYSHNVGYVLDEDCKINQQYLLNVLSILSGQEQVYYTDFFNNKRFIRQSETNDPYEIEIFKFNENIIPHYFDPIKLGNPNTNISEWKKTYYQYYFGNSNLDDIISEYLHGIVWTKHYYFDKCKDNEWFYPYYHGPFLSDIRDFIIKKPECINQYDEQYSVNSVWFDNQIKPLQQLIMVLPLECSFLLPANLRNIMYSTKLKQYFPDAITSIKIDHLYKNSQWQNIPLISIIPPRKVLNLTNKLVLSEDEMNRNKEYEDVIVNKK